jgi:hypothetical protein
MELSIPNNLWNFNHLGSPFWLIGWLRLLGMPVFDRLRAALSTPRTFFPLALPTLGTSCNLRTFSTFDLVYFASRISYVSRSKHAALDYRIPHITAAAAIGTVNNMTREEWALNYQRCSREERIRFVRDRCPGEDVSEDRNNFYYLRQLKDLDKDITFRFLDLPPELRDIVYDLLVNDGDIVHHQILRTSKEVQSEAGNILFRDRTFRTAVRLEYASLSFEGLRTGRMVIWGGKYADGSRQQWPTLLRHVRKMELALSYDPAIAGWPISLSASARLHKGFDRFCSATYGAKELRFLKISLTDGYKYWHGRGGYGYKQTHLVYRPALEGIMALRKLETVAFRGLKPAVKTRLENLMRQHQQKRAALESED